MIVLEDSIEMTDKKEENEKALTECERRMRKEMEKLTFDIPSARKELFIARYIKKSAAAFGASQG